MKIISANRDAKYLVELFDAIGLVNAWSGDIDRCRAAQLNGKCRNQESRISLIFLRFRNPDPISSSPRAAPLGPSAENVIWLPRSSINSPQCFVGPKSGLIERLVQPTDDGFLSLDAEILRIELLPRSVVITIELCPACRQNRKILQPLIVGQDEKALAFQIAAMRRRKLLQLSQPQAAGQKRRHFGVERGNLLSASVPSRSNMTSVFMADPAQQFPTA